jgi:cytochrome oxidase Cu insertion factor (SCO1/SenC/PrrC family)
MRRQVQWLQARSRHPAAVALWSLLAVCALLSRADAQKLLPPDPAVSVGNVIPFDGFIDEEGRDFASLVRAADGSAAPQAWIVSPIYTRCLHTCTPITASLRSALDKSDLQASEYRVLSFSFDPGETPEGLRDFRTRMQLPQRWLTLRATDGIALDRTLKALDFRTITIGEGAIEHPNLIAILAPDRRLVQYLFGVTFSPPEVGAAVRRARAGVSPLARWDPHLFGFAAVGLIVSAFVFFSLLSRRRARRAQDARNS